MALSNSNMRLLVRSILKTQIRCMGGGDLGPIRPPPIHGNREVVGFGINGTAFYIDRVDYPAPAIRYKEPTNDIVVSI